MQEEVENRTIHLVVSMSRVSMRALMDGIRKYVHATSTLSRTGQSKSGPHGKMTVCQLLGQGGEVRKLPIGGEDLRRFVRVLRRHGVDFALVREKYADPPRYLAFFKAKDEAVFKSVIEEGLRMQLSKEELEKKPSVREKLKELRKKALPTPRKRRQKQKDLSL